MSSPQTIYRVIALHERAEEIESIMNQLRNHGFAVRATMVSDFKVFLNETVDQTWDLILAQHNLPTMSLETVAEHIKKLDKDMPMVVLVDHYDAQQVGQFMKMGACAVLPVTDIEAYFECVIGRELLQLRERRKLRKAEVGLDEVEKRCQLLLESSRDAIAYVADGMHILANAVYVELFGYEEVEEMYALPLMDMVASESQSGFKEAFKNVSMGGAGQAPISVKCLKADESIFEVNMYFSPARYQGEACLQLLIRTQDAATEPAQKLQEMSKLDVATGLLNRYHFEQSLNQMIKDAVNNHVSYVMYYISLSQYNKMRAKIGVEGIDVVCKDMAQLLRDHTADAACLARFAEDVYVVLYQQPNVDQITELAQSFCDMVKDHLFDLESQTLQLTASVGVALLSEKAQNATTIISRAKQSAAWVDEHLNGQGFHVYDRTSENRQVETDEEVVSALDLQKAFDNNLFKILFQPIINLRGSSSEFYEVLLRRVNEDGSFESPEAFLKTAESAKVASIVDRWVIIQSVKALVARASQGYDTKILINLTPQSLQDKTFIPWLTVALKTTHLKPGSVAFQVNQADATQHLKRVQELAVALKELACQFSVSRLAGCEASSNIVKHVPLNFVKLDSSFTKNHHNDDVQADFNQLITQVHSMDILSIATQVESAGVLSGLWQVGVHYIQGYYLQPPMDDMSYDFSQEDEAETG